MTALFFYEQRDHAGRWWPVRDTTRPTVRDGRLQRVSGTGPRVRNVFVLPRGFDGHNLDQLGECLGQDGKFFATCTKGLERIA